MRSRLRALACSLILCAATSAQAWAQESASAPAAAAAPVASPAAATDIRGVVHGADGNPVGGAIVEARGPVSVSATTDANGSYDLHVPPGVYRVTVTMQGFQTATEPSLIVSGAGVISNVSLTPLAASRYQTIGRAQTTVERSQFNTTPASVNTLVTQDFDDQGRPDNLGKMLDEIPGVSTVTATGSYYSGLGMLQDAWLNPQVRGAFSYETAQTYEGFPLLTADPGSGFNAGLMTTVGLGGIDIIKGPGADSTTINGAVGGTINYRSLDPTLKPKLSLDANTDGLGGSLWKARATGTLLNGRLGYALGYESTNSPGVFSAHGGYPSDWVQGGNYNDVWVISYNGQSYLYPGCTNPAGYKPNDGCMGNTTTVHTNPTEYQYESPYVFCCRTPLSKTDEWSEYGKLVYHVTPADSPSGITADLLYSGTLFKLEEGGYRGPTLFGGVFEPLLSAGYNGSIPYGTTINAPWYSVDDAFTTRWQNTVEANIRGKVGPGYFHVGYLSLYQMNDWYEPAPTSPINTQVWGTIPLVPFVNGLPPSYASVATAPTAGSDEMVFNGQTVQFEEHSIYANDEYEHMHDWLADYRIPFGQNSIALSWTQSVVQPEQGTANTIDGIWAESALQEPAEHYNLLKQTNNEFRLTSSVQSGKLTALGSLYYNQYDNYLSPLGVGPTETAVSLAAQANPAKSSTPPGALWNWVTYSPGVVAAFPTALAIQNYANTFTNNYNYDMAPRLAFAYRLNNDTSLRFSTGGSIVPLPILALAAGGASLPTYNTTYGEYTQAIAPTGLKPETSWGYDLGADLRVPQAGISVKGDVYLTNLQNQFFTHDSVVGSYNGIDSTGNTYGNAPLLDTSLQNLGHSRYEGIELAVRRDVTKGFGFVAQGYLERAYAYDLPANFYTLPGYTSCSSTGVGCQNLGIVANANFNNGGGTGGPSGVIGSDFSIAPYSGGYGEVSYHWGKYNSFARFGGTYYGHYNTFHQPAFFLLNMSVHQQFGPHIAAQATWDNIGNLYTSPFTGGYAAQVPAVAGVPVPEANGQYAFAPYLTVGPSVVEFALQYR